MTLDVAKSVTERPTLLTLGLALTLIRSAGILICATLLVTTGFGREGLLLFHPEPRELIPLSPRPLEGGLALLRVLAFYGLTLVACLGAWRGGRRWTLCLAFLAALGLLNSGPLGITINGITLFGCARALDDREAGGRPTGL